MHDRHQVHVLMAVEVKGGVIAAKFPESANLSLDFLMELTGDALSPRVYGW